MEQPNRNYTDGTYRYGFQGQEKDDELKGKGNSINYKYRMHDPRVGRFFAIDPLADKYPHNSTYAFSENRVVDGIELEGLEVLTIGGELTASGVYSSSVGKGYLFDFSKSKIQVYGYKSESVTGLDSNIGFAGEISVVFFPTMTSFRDAEGSGTVTGFAWGEGIVGSTSIVTSGEHVGNGFTLGLGISLLPYSAFDYKTNTQITGPENIAAAAQLLIENKSKILESFDKSLGQMSKRASLLNIAIGKAYKAMKDIDNKINDLGNSESMSKTKSELIIDRGAHFKSIANYRKELEIVNSQIDNTLGDKKSIKKEIEELEQKSGE